MRRDQAQCNRLIKLSSQNAGLAYLDARDRAAQGGMAGCDGDCAGRGGKRTYPGGADAAWSGEVETGVADEHGGAFDVQRDLPGDVGAGRAIAVDRTERQPGGVHAVSVNFSVVG